MEADKIPPHLSAEEHSVCLAEEQLLKEGGQWLKSAARLYTQTPKLKIWVPVLGSLLVTLYYLYSIHASTPPKQTETAAVRQSAPVAVAEPDDPQDPQPLKTATIVTAAVAPDARDVDLSDSEILQRAQQAHAGQQFADEAKLLQKILDHSQEPQQACPEIGKAYERAGQIDSAIQSFQHCISLAPGDVDTMLSLAHAFQAKPDFKRASALYRQGLERDPGNLDAQTGLALIELKQNHLHEADAAAFGVLHKSPDNTDALLITGIVAWRQARLADAERIFSQGTALDDHRADFHVFLGRIAEAQRRPQDALQQYDKALILDPNDTDVADRRARLRDTR